MRTDPDAAAAMATIPTASAILISSELMQAD
jgi:hypothetical protein